MLLRRFFMVILVLLNLIFLYQILLSDQGLYAYRDLKGRSEALKGQIQTLDERSLALSQEIRWLKSDRAYLERVIRTEMNFLRENEILYTFNDNASVGGDKD